MIVDGVRIDFGLIIDKTIEEDTITPSSTLAQTEMSNLEDTLNTDKKDKIAYLEDDYWLLDGSFVVNEANLIPDCTFENEEWEAWFSYTNAPYEATVEKSNEYVQSGTFTYKIRMYSGWRLSAFLKSKSMIKIKSGHRYFCRMYYKQEGNGSPSYYFIYKGKEYAFNPSLGLHYLYFLAEEDGLINFEIRIENGGSTANNNNTVYVDSFFFIDLTEIYGERPSELEIVNDFNDTAGGNYINPFYNVGFESESISDSLGDFKWTPVIIYNFEKLHDSYGITMKFPPQCIPRDFTIIYRNGDEEVGTTFVTNNFSELYTNEDTRLQWNKVLILFDKMDASKRARLQYVVFGVGDQYEEDELLEVSVNKTMNIYGDYAESGQAKFSFFNDGRFDIQTIKELSQNVVEKLKFEVYFRKQFENEYKLFGTYYVEEGTVEENGYVISMKGHDGLYKLDDVTFTKGKVYPEGRSLAEWAQEVADFAGVKIEISEHFNSLISTGYIASVPCREALRLISEAGQGILGIDENDVIHLWSYDDIVTEKGGLLDENIVERSLSLSNPNKYMGVKVTQYGFTEGKPDQPLGHIENFELTGEMQNVEIDFTQYPIREIEDIIAPFAQVTIKEIQPEKIVLEVVGKSEDITNITILGTAYDSFTSFVERGETKKNVKEITDNYLITAELVESVADYQLEHAVAKYEYEFESMTNNEISLGDNYEIQKNSIIVTNISVEISYDDQEENIEGVDK